jgi:hypothetical protein
MAPGQLTDSVRLRQVPATPDLRIGVPRGAITTGATDVQNARSDNGGRGRSRPLPPSQSGTWVAVHRIAACLVLSSLAGCAGVIPKGTAPDLKPWPEIRPDYRVETLRPRMHEHSMLADMRRFREEFDSTRSELLPAERVASIESDLHTNAAAVDQLAASVECRPEAALNERRIVLEEMSRQRALVIEAMSAEREQAVDAMVRGFATEGSALLRSVDEQRLATLEWATAERRETLAEIERELAASIEAIRGERAVAVNELREIIDLELLRIALFLAAAVVLAPFVAHAYVRLWPRRRCERSEVVLPRR